MGLAPDLPRMSGALSHAQMREVTVGQPFPIRIVWPDRDRVLPSQRFGIPTLDRIPDAQLRRIADVGHVPMSDAPAKVAALILYVTTNASPEASAPTLKAETDAD